jgi:hypothetical protein
MQLKTKISKHIKKIVGIHKQTPVARISSMKEVRLADEPKRPDYPAILSTKHITILPQKTPSDSRNLPKVMMDLSGDQRTGTKSNLDLKYLKQPQPDRQIQLKRLAVKKALEHSSLQLQDSSTLREQERKAPASQAP